MRTFWTSEGLGGFRSLKKEFQREVSRRSGLGTSLDYHGDDGGAGGWVVDQMEEEE